MDNNPSEMNSVKNSNARIKKIRYLLCAFTLLVLVVIILPFVSWETYSIIENTTSHLGAQHAPYAWLMNIVFMLVGLTCVIEVWLHLKSFLFHKILLSIFGVGLFLTGVFRHAPIVDGMTFNATEDMLHSVFASTVGFSFTIFAISAAFIEKKTRYRVLDFIIALSATLLSLCMMFYPEYSGIWQRMIFATSFIWLIFFFERMRGFDFDDRQLENA